MRTFEDNSVHAVVTDPPYGLSFMGKKWDVSVPAADVWEEYLRVLKPGGHLLAFAGTRTQHRMATRIEDAGFEIRDIICWVYGSGFPKSHDVSKALDRKSGVEREVVGRGTAKGMQGCSKRNFDQGARPYVNGIPNQQSYDLTDPATDAAKEWAGWGSALKPAMEMITLARKPLIGTIVENVLEHGTGGLNIDATRIQTEDKLSGGMASNGQPKVSEGWDRTWMHNEETGKAKKQESLLKVSRAENLGRWPANFTHDSSDEVMRMLPNGSYRFFYSPKAQKTDRNEGCQDYESTSMQEISYTGRNGFGCLDCSRRTPSGIKICPRCKSVNIGIIPDNGVGRTGIPSQNHHCTVKPTDLMRWLCRLITPTGGIVLDPFMGSGSTGKAAMLEGFKFIGIERDAEYMEIAKKRLEQTQVQRNLFEEIAS